MWPITLSGRLPIVDLVGRYLTNYLMGREPLLCRLFAFTPRRCLRVVLYRISTNFSVLSRCIGQVAHVLLTRPPLTPLLGSVRLACVKHAASVRPEPGSNSLVQFLTRTLLTIITS